MSEFKRENQRRRTDLVRNFCKQYNFDMVMLNHGYQLRVEGIVDLFPVRGLFHWLPTGERGGWESINDLRKIMLERLPTPELRDKAVATIEADVAKRRIAKGDQVFNVEAGEQPIKGIHMAGVNKVRVYEIQPGQDYNRPSENPFGEPSKLDPSKEQSFMAYGVKTMTYAQYNKWYRQLWRWVRGTK